MNNPSPFDRATQALVQALPVFALYYMCYQWGTLPSDSDRNNLLVLPVMAVTVRVIDWMMERYTINHVMIFDGAITSVVVIVYYDSANYLHQQSFIMWLAIALGVAHISWLLFSGWNLMHHYALLLPREDDVEPSES